MNINKDYLKIIIKDYSREGSYYHLDIDIDEYNKNNLNLYFLIKKSYISYLITSKIGDLSGNLIRFENNLVTANLNGEITSHKMHIFTFDEYASVQISQRDYKKNEALDFKYLFKKIKRYINNKLFRRIINE